MCDSVHPSLPNPVKEMVKAVVLNYFEKGLQKAAEISLHRGHQLVTTADAMHGLIYETMGEHGSNCAGLVETIAIGAPIPESQTEVALESSRYLNYDADDEEEEEAEEAPETPETDGNETCGTVGCTYCESISERVQWFNAWEPQPNTMAEIAKRAILLAQASTVE